jgi:hypothetical protein
MFRPYAMGAAHAGMLATGKYGAPGPADPNRGLSDPTIPPNDPEAFLNALVERKHNLANDLGALYDKAATHRASALLGGQPYVPPQTPDHPKYYSPPPIPMKPYHSGPTKHWAPPQHQPAPAPEPFTDDDEFDDDEEAEGMAYQDFLQKLHAPAHASPEVAPQIGPGAHEKKYGPLGGG